MSYLLASQKLKIEWYWYVLQFTVTIFTLWIKLPFEQCSSITEVAIFETFLRSVIVFIGHIGGSGNDIYFDGCWLLVFFLEFFSLEVNIDAAGSGE